MNQTLWEMVGGAAERWSPIRNNMENGGKEQRGWLAVEAGGIVRESFGGTWSCTAQGLDPEMWSLIIAYIALNIRNELLKYNKKLNQTFHQHVHT